MNVARANAEPRLWPCLVKGYFFGTVASATALHLATAIIAPGDGGTMIGISSIPILFTIIVVLGFIGLFAFPVVALSSWPVRGLVVERPALALLLAVVVGTGIGTIFTATHFQIGPNDFWSGSVVGLVFAVVWFLVVKNEHAARL